MTASGFWKAKTATRQEQEGDDGEEGLHRLGAEQILRSSPCRS